MSIVYIPTSPPPKELQRVVATALEQHLDEEKKKGRNTTVALEATAYADCIILNKTEQAPFHWKISFFITGANTGHEKAFPLAPTQSFHIFSPKFHYCSCTLCTCTQRLGAGRQAGRQAGLGKLWGTGYLEYTCWRTSIWTGRRRV